jgi:hypothetical protein
MKIQEYIQNVPNSELYEICTDLYRVSCDDPEVAINALIDLHPELEEDNSHLSDLIPRFEKRFRETMHEVAVIEEWARINGEYE